jgi:hypothetical protein
MTAKMSVSTGRSLDPSAVVLPKSEDWLFVETEGEPSGAPKKLVDYIPGTWCERQDWMNPEILAIFACPACHETRLLTRAVHTISPIGLVQPDIQCKGNRGTCSYHRKTYLDRWNRKPLYAAAVEVWDPRKRTWSPEMVYTHATNQEEATRQLGQTIDGKSYRIVGVAPAIGFFVADGKDDTKLLAD